MMKKTLVLILGLMLLLVFSGCSSGESKPWGLDEETSNNSTVTSEPDVSDADVSEDDTSSDDDEPTVDGEAGEKALAAVELAKSLIGTEFKSGGTGPDQFDNSGFVYYCFTQSGVSVPRLTKDIALAGTEVSREEMLPGDIAVFCNEIGGSAGFVGIYIGNGQFIACNNPTTTTKIQNFEASYWVQRFICGRRVA